MCAQTAKFDSRAFSFRSCCQPLHIRLEFSPAKPIVSVSCIHLTIVKLECMYSATGTGVTVPGL
jgi:hypothetical protein